MTLHYRIYGLSVGCDVELPEATPSAPPADGAAAQVRVRLGVQRRVEEPSRWFNKSPFATGEPFLACAKIEGGYLLRFEGLADFVIDRTGREIVCARKASGISLLTLRHLLLDQTLPLVLNLLGKEAVHATAVLTPHGACAFIGPGGSGKSTLAASFLLAGYPVISDDCLVLEQRDRIFAIPAYPGLRLWQDAVEALSDSSDQPMPVAEYSSKARLLGPRASASFPREPHPLIRIYRLLRGGGELEREAVRAPRIAAMTARQSFIELLWSAFPLDITDRPMLARQFHFFERVVASVPLRQLLVPNDFSSLSAVRQAVLEDLDNQ